MKMYLRILMSLLLATIQLVGFAQQAYFQHFNSSTGLSENSVFDIVQDDLGYIWLGTLNGLNRYDGYEFKVFKPRPGKEGTISSNYIRRLAKGKDGNVWAVTNSGDVNRYIAASETFETFPDSLFPQNLHELTEISGLSDGKLLIALNEKLFIFDPLERIARPVKVSKPISDLKVMQDGNVCIRHGETLSFYEWEGTTELNEIYQIKKKVFAFTLKGHWCYYASGHGIRKMKIDFSSDELLFKLDELSASQILEKNVNDISVDGDRYWLVAEGALYSVNFDGENFVYESHKPNADSKGAIIGEIIQQVFTDKLGNTWAITIKSGVNHFNKSRNRFSSFFIPQRFSQQHTEPIRSILPLSDGYLVAFDRSGLGFFDKSGINFSLIDYSLNKRTTFIRAICKDSNGSIWIADANGILIYNNDNKQLTLNENLISWSEKIRARAIKELDSGKLYFAGSGLVTLDLETSETSFHPKLSELGLAAIRDLTNDNEGNLWLATDRTGLIFYPEKKAGEIKKITSETANGALSDDKLYSVAYVDGQVWVGTHNGLNIIDTKDFSIRYVFEADGLTDNMVYGLFVDEFGYVWASTGRGLNRINAKTLEIDTYLHDFYFMDDANAQGKDGKIYFGGYNGFISIDPKNFGRKPGSPTPIVHSFKLFNQPIFPKDVFEGEMLIQNPIHQLDKIELKHTHNTFSFVFDAMPVLSPNPTRYRYKLLRYDDRWIYVDPEYRQASFTNVPPGNYVFRVESALNDSDWGSYYKEINIVINPPFWDTTWFKVICVVAIIGLLRLLYYLRTTSIKNQNKELIRQVAIQTSELTKQNEEIVRQKDEMVDLAMKLHEADDAKLNVFTTVSHEFRTPLTLIMGHLEMLITKESKNPVKSLSLVKHSAQRLLRLTNQLIEVRKIDQGKSKLRVSRFQLSDFCQSLFQSFEPLAAKRKIKLHFLDFLKEKEVWLDMDKMEHICYNLLSNAIKYSKENGNITLRLEDNDNNFSVIIDDDGVGIAQKELPHIFESFYRSSNEQHVQGHGIGLTLVKVFTEQMSGEVNVESEQGKGTVFTLVFNKGKKHFEQGVIVREPTLKKDNFQPQKSTTDLSIDLPTQGAKILIVEDNIQLREYIKEVLSVDFAVSEAANGEEALVLLEEEKPALVVSDLMMPVMDGLTFGKKMKGSEFSAHIPLILLTAKTDTVTKIKGFDSGADDFIEKPFEPSLLRARVKALLQNRKSINQWAKDDLIKAADPLKIGSADKSFLENVKKCVVKNLSDPNFSIEKMGNELGMSRSTFYRKFKSLTGISANDYLKKERLQRASALLQEGNIPISAICFEVGFQSQAHFRNSFKKEFGATPSQHREDVGG